MTPSMIGSELNRLVERALTLAPEAREALFDEACGQNQTIRAALESLLMHAPGTASFADEGTTTLDGCALGPGQRIGSFQLVREIGVGGMGAVYEAEQDQPRRSVALKILQGRGASARVRRYFEHEIEYLATLDHPGIATIHQAGIEPDGTPWFAMELVEAAKPLTEFARDNSLSPRERVTLLIRVAEAVHHAHQRGIIHRDLKPSNVLVDSDGAPKIVDFGIARATEVDVQATLMREESGALVGTLPYMSPEQCSGDPFAVDLRTDVYALGAIGYELLASRHPLDLSGTDLPTAIHKIRHEEPPRLGTLDSTLRGDLDAIMGRALEKEPARRYGSSLELARDLGRHLENEPVHARPATVVYKVGRFVRRNRALSTVLAVLLLVIAGSGVGMTLLTLSAQRSAHEANESLLDFETAQTLLTRGILAAVDLGSGVTLAQYFERLDERAATLGDRPQVERIIRSYVGHFALAVDDGERASRNFRRALALATSPRDTRELRVWLAEARTKASDLHESIALAEGALQDAQAAGDGMTAMLARRALASTHHYAGHFEKSLPLYEAVVRWCDQNLEPTDAHTLTAYNCLGLALRRTGHLERAESCYRTSLEGHTRAYGAEAIDTLQVRYNLASLLKITKRPREAAAELRAVLKVVTRIEPDTVFCMTLKHQLGNMMLAAGRKEEALRLFQHAAKAIRAEQRGSINYAELSHAMAVAYKQLGRWAEALSWARETVAIYDRVHPGHQRADQHRVFLQKLTARIRSTR